MSVDKMSVDEVS